MQIDVLPLSASQMKAKVADESTIGFGKIFTDRMLLVEWTPDKGWHNARIKPYEPFVLDPAALVFHYAQEIFEGLKAYRWADGRIALFRPERNAQRFNQSAERMCMPAVPEELFVEGIKKLVALEQDWVPASAGTSLYIRPTMIAVEPILGVKPSDHYYFYVIMCPVGPYYAAGFNPVKILVEDYYVRAVPGGTGEAKTGGNYASSLKAGLEAKKKGYDQVLWLDGRQQRYIEEVGAMNMFFAYGSTIVTSSLTGSILAGITRDSVLTLAQSMGLTIEERLIDVHELLADIKAGLVTEAFGSGTAAVITPVGSLRYQDLELNIGNGGVGRITQQLYDTLTGIQTGSCPDQQGWITLV